jgi:NAD(P)-dependent dehydrogenase (short-subunit alcohol dehydrogenase family)
MTELLEGKTAIIYGGGGGIGGGVARTFGREGAKVFLAGRTRETFDTVAKESESAGGSADVAVLDALDEQAVEEHLREVTSNSGEGSPSAQTAKEMIAGMAALRRTPGWPTSQRSPPSSRPIERRASPDR